MKPDVVLQRDFDRELSDLLSELGVCAKDNKET